MQKETSYDPPSAHCGGGVILTGQNREEKGVVPDNSVREPEQSRQFCSAGSLHGTSR